MTLKSNGFTVSGRFPAKTTRGTCPECSEGLVATQPSVFLRARGGADGKAEGVLTADQRKEFGRLERAAQGIARSRGILPRTNKSGRRARRQRRASLREVGTSPSWLYDHMIHFDCLPAFAGGASIRDIAGNWGERAVGMSHGAEVVPMTPAELAAQAATRLEALERGRRELAAADAAAVVADQAARVAAVEAYDDARGDRMRRVVAAAWDDTPAPPLEEGRDASVERFKLLDLD